MEKFRCGLGAADTDASNRPQQTIVDLITDLNIVDGNPGGRKRRDEILGVP